MARGIDFCKQVSFELFLGDNRCFLAYIVKMIIPNLGSIEGKLFPKCLTCKEKIEKKELPGTYGWSG